MKAKPLATFLLGRRLHDCVDHICPVSPHANRSDYGALRRSTYRMDSGRPHDCFRNE